MTQYSLSELARLVDGQLHGDGDTVITGADTIRDAGPGEITLADSRKLATDIDACQAAAVVTSNGFAPTRIPYITVENVHDAFTKIVSLFRPHHHSKVIGVSAAAVVSPTARLGHNVTVHPNAVIGDDVEIESGTTIHSGAQIMAGCKIGADTVIFPNVVLYENSLVGDRCIIHSGVMVGAFGFGYSTIEGKHQLSAQMGFVRIGNDVEIGANTTIDRGTYGATVIGDGTKIDNQVQIAHNCRIGRHNILCSQVGIAGSTTTGDYVVMGGQVGVRDHVHIGDGARLGAKAGVMTNIPAGGAFVGIPATPERDQMMIQASLMKLPKLKKQIRELTKTVDELEHANPFRSQNEAA